MVSKETLPGVELNDASCTAVITPAYVPPKVDKMQPLAQVTGAVVITGAA